MLELKSSAPPLLRIIILIIILIPSAAAATAAAVAQKITPLAAEDPKQLFPEPLGLDTLRQNKTRQDKNPRKHAWGQVPLLGAPVPLSLRQRPGANKRATISGAPVADPPLAPFLNSWPVRQASIVGPLVRAGCSQ